MANARTPVVVGNWKLNNTLAESLELVTALKNQLASIRGVEVGVAPGFLSIATVAKRLGESSIGVAAQDCYWEPRGAFTGEVSASLIKDAGCTYAIVGHSERRHVFGETDDEVGRKAKAAIEAGLTAIVCVGETEDERDSGKTMERVASQLEAAIAPIAATEIGQLIVAYEPVWAIGTGRTASPAQAQEVHAQIREQLRGRYSQGADQIRLQYGGSVKPANAESLLAQADVDGALVGGASLKPGDFVAIIKAAKSSVA